MPLFGDTSQPFVIPPQTRLFLRQRCGQGKPPSQQFHLSGWLLEVQTYSTSTSCTSRLAPRTCCAATISLISSVCAASISIALPCVSSLMVYKTDSRTSKRQSGSWWQQRAIRVRINSQPATSEPVSRSATSEPVSQPATSEPVSQPARRTCRAGYHPRY